MLNSQDPGHFTMEQAPLVQALAQVHYPQIARLSSLAGVEPVQDALLDLLPYMRRQKVQELAITLGPGEPGTEASDRTLTKFTDDEGWTFEVSTGAATLICGSNYAGVDDFAARFETCLDALSQVRGMRRCDRIGVRYINAAAVPDASSVWSSWFREELLGWTRRDLLSKGTTVAATITEARTRQRGRGATQSIGDVDAVIRHGLLPAGSMIPMSDSLPLAEQSFILDMDFSVASHQPLATRQLVDEYRDLHSEIERFFYWTLTPNGRERFGVHGGAATQGAK